jgi:hypothetical protein
VVVADGTVHPIKASGTLLGHPSIHADVVPTFTQNLIGISPILERGAVGIIKHDKMRLIESNPYVEKLVDFAIEYSKQNNLIIMTGSKQNGLYVTPLTQQPTALLTTTTQHFTTISDMVYYFYLVFNCPHVEAYCRLVSSNQITGLPSQLTVTAIRKFYPHQDPIKPKSQLTKQPIKHFQEKNYQLTFCGEQVEIDILLVSTPTSSIPKATNGYRHVVSVVDVYSSILSYVPIKTMSRPHRFVETIVTSYLTAVTLSNTLKWTINSTHPTY